jgi:hypothetical protein
MADRLLTPQQEKFLENYTNPKSDTFSNAMQSAIKAGYKESYADNILALMPDWLCDYIGDMSRLKKAEKKLDEILEIPAVDPEGKVDNSLLANQIKVASLYAKGLGKHKYSERSELTGANGEKLNITFDSAFKDESTQ